VPPKCVLCTGLQYSIFQWRINDAWRIKLHLHRQVKNVDMYLFEQDRSAGSELMSRPRTN
jgi:hypothetical protein